MIPTSKQLVRELNELNVLQDVFNNGPISRSQVAKDLGLNKVTVSDIFATLLDAGYLQTLGTGVGSLSGGRKPVMHRFNQALGYVISFDLGYHYLDIMVNLLDGQVVSTKRYFVEGQAILARLGMMMSLIQDFQKNPPVATDRGLMGIAIAFHGVIDHNQVKDSPFLEVGDLDIVGYFQQALKVPVLLENEANLAALYARDFTEVTFPHEQLVTISMHKGIGAGVIIDGALFHGVGGRAGEIGRSLVNHDGHMVKIEALCSEDAIVDQARKALHDDNIALIDLRRMMQAGDPMINRLMADFVERLGMLLHNVAVSFAPQTIVLNSALLALLPDLLPALQTAVGSDVKLSICEDVKHAITLGGCSLIVHQVLKMGSRQLHFHHAHA